MMSPFEQSVDAWLSSMEVRLRGFVRGDLFLIAQTPDKEWWAQVIDDATVTVALIKDLLTEAKHSVGGCLEASQGRSKRVSVRGKQVYAYQLIYWAGNALIPSSKDVVRHKCHNRRCINPLHLTHGTQLDNVNDTRDR